MCQRCGFDNECRKHVLRVVLSVVYELNMWSTNDNIGFDWDNTALYWIGAKFKSLNLASTSHWCRRRRDLFFSSIFNGKKLWP